MPYGKKKNKKENSLFIRKEEKGRKKEGRKKEGMTFTCACGGG